VPITSADGYRALPRRAPPEATQEGKGFAVILDPDTYVCPDHKADLTDLVREKLEEDVHIAYVRLPGFSKRWPRQFKVTVNCPGEGGTGAHDLTCTGTRTK